MKNIKKNSTRSSTTGRKDATPTLLQVELAKRNIFLYNRTTTTSHEVGVYLIHRPVLSTIHGMAYLKSWWLYSLAIHHMSKTSYIKFYGSLWKVTIELYVGVTVEMAAAIISPPSLL